MARGRTLSRRGPWAAAVSLLQAAHYRSYNPATGTYLGYDGAYLVSVASDAEVAAQVDSRSYCREIDPEPWTFLVSFGDPR